MSSFEKKREEFRKYLECAGVIDSLSKALIKLYEEGEKPEDAVQFLREHMCETCATEGQVKDLREKYEEALVKISQLEREVNALKSNIRLSPSEVQLHLEQGYETLQAYKEKPSLLQEFMTRDIFDSLKEVKTSFNSTLYDCIRSGLAHPNSHIGVYAPDKEAYTVFADLFDPIIEKYHGFAKDANHPATDWGDESVFANLDPDNEYIRSTRIRCARSIENHPFNPCMKESDYEEIMEQLKGVTECFEDEYQGNFYPLLGMNKETQQQLIDDHFLFKEGDEYLQDAGACRFWPVGRGIFHNSAKTFLIWCCEEDHIRIISMEQGGDLGKVYGRLKNGVAMIEKEIPFSRDDRLGFLTFCPTNLGTTIRASVHINLPKLSADLEKLEAVAAKYNLQVRGTAGEHTESSDGYYDISNKRRLGLTEFEAVKEMYDGIQELIKAEKEM